MRILKHRLTDGVNSEFKDDEIQFPLRQIFDGMFVDVPVRIPRPDKTSTAEVWFYDDEGWKIPVAVNGKFYKTKFYKQKNWLFRLRLRLRLYFSKK